MIRIQVDLPAFNRILTTLEEDQIPYAMSRALNDTALGAQDEMRTGLRSRFIIRRDWVPKQIKISKFSDKRDSPMKVTIGVGDSADFLDKFEPGGTKSPRSGAHIAVPIMARASKQALVPKALRPRNLHLHAVGKSIRGDQRTFLVTMKGGRQAIFQRTGPRREEVKLLYWLTPSVPIPASLKFFPTIEDAVNALWPINFNVWFEEAIRTAKPDGGSGSGRTGSHRRSSGFKF